MAIQPNFNFARRRAPADEAESNKARDTAVTESASDGEKYLHPRPERPDSVSSFSSDEKQQYGVSKVEAVTSVWTRPALITLYVL
jgi:hypothetical protein